MKQYKIGQKIKVTPKGRKPKLWSDKGVVCKANYIKTWGNGTTSEVIAYLPQSDPIGCSHIIRGKTHDIEILKSK